MLSVARQQETIRLRLLLVAAASVLLAAGLGVAAGELALGNRVQLVAIVVAVLVPAAFWRIRSSLVMAPLAIAILVEQYTSSWPDATTDRLPLFKSLSDAAGLTGVYVNPFEIVLLAALVTWIVLGVATRRLDVPRSELALGVLLLVLVAAATEVHGVASGGNFNQSFWELRPWVYLGAGYLLTAAVATPRTLWAMLWTVVLCTGYKGLQGTLRFLSVRSGPTRPQEILEHIEALFFSCFIVLVIALWLFGIRGRLRTAATVLLPVVVIADLGNNRRAAWIILGAQVAVVGVIAWLRMPERRRLLTRCVAIGAVGAALYLPVFWNSTGAWAQPARAIHSAIAPDARDAASNIYRVVENMNLELNIRQAAILGRGFGIPITTYVSNVDLTQYDPSIAYVQHNTVLYQWWRMGTLGAVLFWWALGVATVLAVRLSRSLDRRWSVYCAFTVAALIGFVIDGWYDMALANLRAPVLIGCLLGGLEVLRRAAHEISAATTAPEMTP